MEGRDRKVKAAAVDWMKQEKAKYTVVIEAK
jgi:hypothetical protein